VKKLAVGFFLFCFCLLFFLKKIILTLFVALQAAYDMMPFLSVLTLHSPSFLSGKVRQSILGSKDF